MKIRTNIYLITATLLTQYALTKCADVSDSNTGPSAYTTEPFDHIDHFDHLDHLDHDIGLEDDHESLEQFLAGSLQPSDLGKTNLNGQQKIIHSVKVIHHGGDSITKYVTTSHTDPAADRSDLFDGVLMPSRQPSNAPGAYTKITKKTIIKQSNSDENSFKEPTSVTSNIYGKNNSREIETGNSMSDYQTVSQIDHMTNDGVPLMSMRPIANSPDSSQNGMRTTITKIITTGSTANDLNGFANGKTNADSKSSNKAISTTSTTNSNSNYNDMVTGSSQFKPLGADVNIETTTTETINGFTGADNQGGFRERPEDVSFRRTKTTVVKQQQQHSNGRDDKFGGLDERDVGHVNGNTMPSENIVYQITPSRYDQLTTTSTTNTIDRNTPSNDGVSTTSSSNPNSDEHNIELDKGNTGFSKIIILSQTNPSSSTTTSTTNAVDEKTTNGDNSFAGDLISGTPDNRLDKSMSLGNSVYGYGISPQMHSDETALPSADMKKNSNNADSFSQTQTKIMGYRGTGNESHAGGSNDYVIKLNADDQMSSLINNANSNYVGSSNNANGMVGNANMMAMDDAGPVSGGYSSSMASMGNNIKGNGCYGGRKKFNRKRYGKRGKKNKMRNNGGKRPNRITVKSSSYEIGGGRRGVARKNRNANSYTSRDYVQTMSPESLSFSKSYTGNPTVQQRRRPQCSCENTDTLNKRSDDNSEIDESDLNDSRMNGAPVQELFNQMTFGQPGPPPRHGGRPRPRGPPPHGRRPPWFRQPPPGPQRNEFINMNRPPGQSPTYSGPDRATVLNGQTKTMLYGEQNALPNYISNVPYGRYAGPPGPSGPQTHPFDSIEAYESNPSLFGQQSFGRYQIRRPYAHSSYHQVPGAIIDGADDDFRRVYGGTVTTSHSEHASTPQWNTDNGDVGFERTGAPGRASSVTTTASTVPSDDVMSNANSNRENAVYTKTVRTTKRIVGNNPADIDVVRTESNYTY